jgi:hypothetical protein
MSGLKPVEMSEFHRRLRARGMSINALADAVARDHSTVSRVLNGARRRGPIWRRLEQLLMPAELALLDVAQASTWNKKRAVKRPRWTPAKAAELRVA